jgi:MFS family permease
MASFQGRDAWLIGLCVARSLSSILFITYAACVPVLVREWDMTATAAGSIASAFQIAYATSLLFFSWLAQRVGARRVLLQTSVLISIAAVAFAALARDYWSGLIFYTLVALSLGGNYTTAIMLLADRYPSARRGTAMGALLASTSFGYALGLGLAGLALPLGGYESVFWVMALGPLLGMLILLVTLRATPNVVHPRPPEARFAGAVLRNRSALRLTAGYTAHSWELLGMWAWTPAFLAACLAVTGSSAGTAAVIGAYLAAGLHIAGFLASLSMGRLSDLWGRRAVLLAMAAGGMACSFVFGWLIGAPVWIVAVLALIYGFTALGDSAVLSTAFTEAIEPAYLGSALALRSLCGFGAGAIAPLVFGIVLDATNPAGNSATVWGWAFGALGVGGLVATVCAYGFRRPS